MPSTWVVGDIHGCAGPLARLLERIRLQPRDRLISVGDLYHRGPDPYGVYEQLAALPDFALVLGNHERALLRRAGLAGRRADGADAPPIPEHAEALARIDRRGDGRAPLAALSAAQFAAMLHFLQRRPYFLQGPGWIVVHASLVPGIPPQATPPDALVRMHRLRGARGQPLWYEAYRGPDLVVYGHVPVAEPLRSMSGDRLVAIDIDTGCVHGGRLTAYCLESGEIAAVSAASG